MIAAHRVREKGFPGMPEMGRKDAPNAFKGRQGVEDEGNDEKAHAPHQGAESGIGYGRQEEAEGYDTRQAPGDIETGEKQAGESCSRGEGLQPAIREGQDRVPAKGDDS